MPRRRSARALSIAVLGAAIVVATTTSCSLPKVPAYPYWGIYGSRQGVINKANDISQRFEAYVKGWLDGRNAAQIPTDLLPDGRDPKIKNWRLARPSEVDWASQWVVREARTPIDQNASPGGYPDPHATYLVLQHAFVPFGTQVRVTGQFPRARFMSVQVTAGFQPEQYSVGGLGGIENPIVDADINPDAGSVNPYRVGANRAATARNYTLRFDAKVANAALTDPSFKPPSYRGAGNNRTTSGILYRGPWGDPNYDDSSAAVDKRGRFENGQIWYRYYGPDLAAGPLGGVPLPRVTYVLPDGREFFVVADLSELRADINRAPAIARTGPAAPNAVDAGPTYGWDVLWGPARNGMIKLRRTFGFNNESENRAYARGIDKGAMGRGEDVPPPGNYQQSKTLCVYCVYFTREMSLESNKVLVLTGRLPSTPKTRNGEPAMTAAQLRYWSLSLYDGNVLDSSRPLAQGVDSKMDDEIVTDANGWYVIVLSRPGERPRNATTASGVTWMNWGDRGTNQLFIRWLSVGPEWTFAKAPTEDKVGRESDSASERYDRRVTATNNRSGFMGEYQPVLSYLDKSVFENLGSGRITPSMIPAWR